MQTLPTLPPQLPTTATPLDSKAYYPEQDPAQGRLSRSIAPPEGARKNIPSGKQFYLGGFTGHSPKDDLKPGNYKGVIYGWSVTPPKAGASLQEREKRIEEYAYRVDWKIKDIESGSEGQRNIKFQDARQFMEPAGYFSAGLLAAGYDPHKKITVTLNSYVGRGTPEHLSNTEKRTYYAWEIAAGALEHDKVERGGPINFNFMDIKPEDKEATSDLESVGKKLQNSWEKIVAAPMRNASGELAERSGKADTYVINGTLQSLRSDKDAFKNLSSEGQETINRTLDKNGQIIIPNLYGYPLAGYAFIPYTPYDGNANQRPNQGLMVDLKNGIVSEINGDKNFAIWAKDNRDNLVQSFNARDRQGGKDAHWPSAAGVLDNLIAGAHALYPGRQNILKDKEIPVSELFNYTQSRGSDYTLKFGNLNNDIASKFQQENAKNALWSDQTEVFGSSQQSWKAAKDLWGNTFGYLPFIGNTGNIVFGAHDSLYGKTAQDRDGGTAAAVISGLQLAHELAFAGAEGAGAANSEAENVATRFNSSAGQDYHWKHNAETSSYELERSPKAANGIEPPPNQVPKEGAIALKPLQLTDAEKTDLEKLNTIKNLPTGEALFSTDDSANILSGDAKDLKHINEKLYTFTDDTKLGNDSRLNIVVHGGIDDSTGTSKVSYNGKLNTPQELLETLHQQGIRPEEFKKVRLLSCYSANGAEQSFAAEFQKLINRPVKGYEGTLTAYLTPEVITEAMEKVETAYLNHLKQSNTNLTPAVKKAVKIKAEEYVNNNLAKTFKAVKTNPHWNPIKWWFFTYKPVHFGAKG
ncbi:hypothetical protein [Pseudomonas brenneri]|uniref:hypothetical protein n=1 Tax=Pseudomonas brenneri TaxID=129817 RepID=UPI0028D6A1DA|nr:hypothetical protein [Pseudomonas brenneri]